MFESRRECREGKIKDKVRNSELRNKETKQQE